MAPAGRASSVAAWRRMAEYNDNSAQAAATDATMTIARIPYRKYLELSRDTPSARTREWPHGEGSERFRRSVQSPLKLGHRALIRRRESTAERRRSGNQPHRQLSRNPVR